MYRKKFETKFNVQKIKLTKLHIVDFFISLFYDLSGT